MINNNKFTGRIRDAFDFFSNLTYFDVGNNQFTGFLPSSLFDIPTIEFIYMSNNSFVGSIPDNCGNPPFLRDLYLDGNLLGGTVPSIASGELQQLTEFLIQNNDIGGIMPDSICELREGALEDLWADCAPPDPEIECDCCTFCFFSSPTIAPTRSSSPSSIPSILPSQLSSIPSLEPSSTESVLPSNEPSLLPSSTESLLPSTEPSLVESVLPSNEPSLLPSSTESLFPSTEPTGCQERNRTEVLLEILLPVTNESQLEDPLTAQGQAFHWLDSIDTETDVCTYPTVVQRYTLAVLYYATDGASWSIQSGWLSDDNECNWFNISCSGIATTSILLGKSNNGLCKAFLSLAFFSPVVLCFSREPRQQWLTRNTAIRNSNPSCT